jgi:WD40 repeat protein
LQNRWIVDTAPLQLYSSAIIFSPETSIIRNTFKGKIPRWICRLPKVPSTWSLELQKLEGHRRQVYAVAFSHDSQLLASASSDRTVRLWNPETEEQLQKLEGHSEKVRAVAFSHDGQLLASASDDRTVRLWNPATGDQLQKIELNIVVSELCFSMDSQCLMTNRGALRLHSSLLTVLPLELKSGSDIFLNGDWVTRNSRNLLWLPHDHRGRCSALKDNILVIGQNSGQVDFIEFSS